MTKAFEIILLIISVLLALSVGLQESKSEGFASSISGGSERFLTNRRKKASETFLSRATVILTILLVGGSVIFTIYSTY